MEYCWQHPHWPEFRYDLTHVRETLYRYALGAGRLSGAIAQVGGALQDEAYIDLMISEAISSSEIENEHLSYDDVRSSIRNYLGLTNPPIRVTDPRAEGISALMVDVGRSFDRPLSPEMLFRWHRLVLPPGEGALLRDPVQVGQWRTSKQPMQIVSGPVGYERVHYEAPPSWTVEAEMARFLCWYNDSGPLGAGQSIPGPARAAVAHLWFEIIHPFDDGNGRIGRAIADHALAQDLNRPPLLSLSSVLEKDRKAYYDHLAQASRSGLDITPWVEWFCKRVLQAQQEAHLRTDFILMKAKFWDNHRRDDLNGRQIKMLQKVFRAGPGGFAHGISAKKYMAMTACSKATATRDLADLVSKGCLSALARVGRNARYALRIDDPIERPLEKQKRKPRIKP